MKILIVVGIVFFLCFFGYKILFYIHFRSIVWLQNQRDQNLERARGSLRRDEVHEFRVGRIKHERVKVPRGEQLLDWAIQVMKTHAERKAILEVEFIDEEGTGLGPTLEFFALVAAELQSMNTYFNFLSYLVRENNIRVHFNILVKIVRMRSTIRI